MTAAIHSLGIDVPTKAKCNLIHRLKALNSTLKVQDGGVYHQDDQYSQIHIETAKSEAELDHWLCQTKGIDYVGTFQRA